MNPSLESDSEDARARIEARIEAIVGAWRAEHESGELLEGQVDLARALLSGSGERVFRTHHDDALRFAVRTALELAARRQPGERLALMKHPEELPGRSVVLLVQDDRPFLVDTLRMLLRRHGLREQLLLHPTLCVERDAAGMLTGVVPQEAPEARARRRESLIYVEVFPRPDAAAQQAFERELDEVMTGVAHVTDDHRRMIRAVREIEANVEFAGRALDVAAGRSDKICRFLDWLVEDHFVLMGVRAYDVQERDGRRVVSIREGEGLGVWRDARDSRFAEPVAEDDLPIGLRRSLDDPRIILISKGWVESRIHRVGRLDRIFVKEHDESGRVCGFHIVSGLFTFAALRTPSSQIPLLAERLDQILEGEHAPAGSHRHKALVAAFDSAPMEFLLGASVEDNAALIREIVEAEGADELRVVLRTDAGGRSFFAAVILPSERYSESLRTGVRRLFERDPGVGYIDDRFSFLEEGSALLYFFCTMTTGEVPDVEHLEREIRRLAARWDDRFTDALVEAHGALEGGELAARYVDAFPEGLHVTTHPADAVHDVDGLEALHETGAPQMSLIVDRFRAASAQTGTNQVLRLYLADERLLTDLLPLIDRMGIRVVDARQIRVEALDRPPAYLHLFRIEPLGEGQTDLDALARPLGDALRAVLSGTMPSDPLNALVLVAGLDWREVDLLRGYLEYLSQIQSVLTRRYVRDVLLQNPAAARLLVRYHAARLEPGLEALERDALEQSLREEFARYRDRIHSLNEDRALGGLFELIDATLRTSFFADTDGAHRIAIKLDPSRIEDVEPPAPYREIFVHAPGVAGIHIRGGPVARGGLRWSDRIDDFRAEVLGLMRTQQLKNGLIVPVGAKGGFVLTTAPPEPREARALADEKYAVFIAALLDVTDDIDAEGRVVPPAGVHRRDGDDPYLVVAADKGTAHLSDTANAIARAGGFWLGDAFASGGSVGYDHKKYAITARGAWECVRHHMQELGIDPERDAYRVVGIGDMSGDVFGNGLLLMRGARLVAAFDHRHVFLDPDPDPGVAWAERKRLFELPGSSWADYDPAKISPGGGVHPRAAKRIDLSYEIRERLGIDQPSLTGPALVRAILAAPVDLLWNGGIGTYVKASHESHADVGDRTNEAVRIDAPALRARIVGEGGNLGLTQAARVEAALAGVRLDTDAIHNSAGVDLSDHEVNFKVLLTPALQSGALAEDARNELLFSVAEDACESALSHNRAQALAISLDERRSRNDLEPFRVAIETLCEAQRVAPADVGLPDDVTLAARARQGEGLARPELAVLLGLAKLDLRLALAGDPLVDDPGLASLYAGYFPDTLRKAWADALPAHRLRREITALRLASWIVDHGGATAITSIVAKRGLAAPAAAAARRSADGILDGEALRRELLGLRGNVPHESVYDGLIELDRAIGDVTRYLMSEELGLVPDEQAAGWRDRLSALFKQWDRSLSSEETDRYRERSEGYEALGLPTERARLLAGAPFADRGLGLIRLIEDTKGPADQLAAAWVQIGERSGIHWMFQQLPFARAESVWDRIVLMDVRAEMLSLQRDLTAQAVAMAPDSPLEAVDAFLTTRDAVLARVRALAPETLGTPSASALAVVGQTLMRLRGQPG